MNDGVTPGRDDARARIGPYEIVEVLHRGPLATVYLALGSDSDREVAVKVAADPARGDFGASSDTVRVARRLVHRHIVRVLDAGDEDGLSYTVMERLRGRRLSECLEDPTFSPDQATRIDLVAQLCTGLHYAHEHGFVHANISPDNVFVTDDGVVKILNFGAASASDHTVVSDNALSGSVEYLSPEQLMGRESIDGRSDLFSAAAILYELLSGRRPFHGASTAVTLARIVKDDPAPLDGMPKLDRLIRRALEKDPAARFGSAQEFAYALWMLPFDTGPMEEPVEPPSETVFSEPASSEPPAADAARSGVNIQVSQEMLAYGVIAAVVLIGFAGLIYAC